MRQTDPIDVAFGGVEVKTEFRAFLEVFGAILEYAATQLWPLKVGEDADRAVQVAFKVADGLVANANVVVAAVAHVQAEDIGAGFEQVLYNLVCRRRRAQRGHDLHISHPAHYLSSHS